MRIMQLLPTVSFGDAVGNDTLAIRDLIAGLGVETGIYAENIDRRLPEGTARPVADLPALGENDLLIYHASTGTQLNYRLPEFGGRKMMIYHNVTPPDFFRGYSDTAVMLTETGQAGFRFLSDKVAYCVADSDFNRQDLRKMGYTCPIDVCPILIPFEDYDQAPDEEVLARYRGDGWTNLLFVGRLAPNKKQEDVIRAFYYYYRHYNPKSRLFLVGSDSGMEIYAKRLRRYAEKLGLHERVIFPGHISFRAILAYYRLADVFVSMSEHEGFCVPVVEAMYFGKPVVAYRAAAVPETLGRAGLLLDTKAPETAAAAIDRILRDGALREALAAEREKKLREYRYDQVSARMTACIRKMMDTETKA